MHNNPTGDLTSTDNEKDLTDQLIQAGRIVGLDLPDHLVISEKTYLSYRDIGLIDLLLMSPKWVPQYEIKEQLRKEITKKVERRKALAIARAMKIEGDSAEKIVRTTGISAEEVEKMKLKESEEGEEGTN